MPSGTKLQSQAPKLPPLSVARMLWKRRWLALVCWLVASIVSVIVVRSLPSIYQSEAVVLVDSQKIPENYVSPTVNGDIADRLALISQDIMSSSRLLQIINSYGLYQNDRRTHTQQEILQRMHTDISISVEQSWTGGHMQAFKLAYQGSDPKVVTEVANRLAGLYVAENTRARETQAEGTVTFFRNQLSEAKRSLDGQESKLAQFKQEHNGVLPEQENSLLSSLSSARVELQGVQDALNRAHENKVSLESSLATAESSMAALTKSLRPGSKNSGPTVINLGDEPQTQSEVLEEKLRTLRLRYTDDYPDIQALEGEIREAKQQELAQAAQMARVLSPSKESSGSDQANDDQPALLVTPELVRAREHVTNLKGQIGVTLREIQTLEKRRQNLSVQIEDYETRINKLPLVEQQMSSLNRDYNESANNYNSLLQKELAANMATDMERSKNSERFTIIDAARIPQKPIKPKRGVLASVGSVAGLALGLAFGFVLELRKQSFLGEWELPAGTVVLGRVPQIKMLSPATGVGAVVLVLACMAFLCPKA